MVGVQKRKIQWAISLLLVMLYFSGLTAQAQYGGGTGEPNDPYLIYTAEQMNAIGLHEEDWDKHFKLMADIDLSGFDGKEGRPAFNIITTDANMVKPAYQGTPFTGVFDGSGHAISNFSYTSTGRDYIGLFGCVDDPNAEIKDLGLIDTNVDAGTGREVGSLVGWLWDGTITNCYSIGSVTGDDLVGGLVGVNLGTITNCSATAGVLGTGCGVGGLVGYNDWGTITNCYATGTVSGNEEVGGLAGMSCGTITNCYSAASVSGSYDVGGLVGENYGTIANCYSTGSISGDKYVGGLVGHNDFDDWYQIEGMISNCYSTGRVSGKSDVGGLVGYNWSAATDCFWDIQTSGQSISAGGMCKTTAEMQNPNTFMEAGWDFVGQPDGPHDIWAEPAGGGYPILWWQLGPLLGLPSFSGGTGEPDNPYVISTAEDLNHIGHNPRLMGVHFKLIKDIDLTGIDFFIIGSNWNFPFNGVFDGNGHTISNFTYTPPDANNIGLFGYVGGEVKDLGLIDPNVDAGTGGRVGSLVGWNRGTITHCYVEGGSVSGNHRVGGLVGRNNGGTITNCYATGSVSGDWGVGGLVGYNKGTITNCYATGSVTGSYGVGGLVGGNSSYGRITECYANGSLSGNSSVGGLVGANSGTITNCYSTGGVSGDRYVGGLVGENSVRSHITNCYATGSVSGNSEVGGLVGSNYAGTITNCYATGDVRGLDMVGGLLGSGSPHKVYNSFWDIQTSGQTISAGGTGKTTAEMQDPRTFMDAGWDFVGQPDGPHDIWAEPVGGGYPILYWRLSPLPELPAFSGGTGTADDPCLVSTADELNSIGHNPRLMDAHFKLINDIDLTGTDFFIIGSYSFPFAGVFDGNGKKISNFSYTSTSANNIGLFAYVTGEIKDLGLIDPNIDAGTGSDVGSLVGRLSGGTITNCYAEGGSVSGADEVGGLVGQNGGSSAPGTITNCYATASVSGDKYVGGLVGQNDWRSTITNCYAAGSVTGEWYIGGLVGSNGDTITNCYATGSVSGQGGVGGLVGYNRYATITNCYSSGSVSGDSYVGGLIGMGGRALSSYWDIQTSGQANSAGGTGKTTAEMQMASTFLDAGWDFVAESINGTEDIWWILEGQDYPRLTWELVGN